MLKKATVDQASPEAPAKRNKSQAKEKNPKTDRKDNQHGMDGMLEDARWRTHWRPSLDRQRFLENDA
jgi:hypothetical protein